MANKNNETTNKNQIASKIYAAVAAKHPDWSQARVYAVTRNILSKGTVKRANVAVSADN